MILNCGPFNPPQCSGTWQVALTRILRPGDLAVDIGAWAGDTAIPMAELVGPSGKVVAFEPNPTLFSLLEENLKANPQAGCVIALNAAVMPNEGIATFYYTQDLCNGGPMLSEWNGHTRPVKVRCVTLESVIREETPRFIKIDTEGGDLSILRSISPLIRRARPYVQFEVFPYITDEDRAGLFDFCIEHRMRPTNQLDQTYATFRENRSVFDVICIPEP